ncbi:MAG: inositol monophosphatase family protein [Burkholderiales bacterium]
MLKQLIQAVKAVAREEIMPRYLKVAHERKADGSLSTQADHAAQAALKISLKKILDCPVLGEEMTEAEQKQIWRDNRTALWCVDPIDGTTNFVNGIPYFAISVALMKDHQSIMGAVYDPVADEIFYAEKGKGAFLNGVELPIKEREPALREAVAEIDLKRLDEKLAAGLAAHPPYSSARNFGASTLDWCYVAAGRFDVYLHGGQKLWDYAAGSLVLTEAGGKMCTLDNDDFWADEVWTRSVVAALHPEVFAAWKTWIQKNK